jgi:EAL domain-containing protein (putative c-di-GMP-specific phosphodiesterase class I)
VVELGEALDMQIVAEGVERRDQLDSLSDMRCNIGQGYYFARPLDSSRMSELITEQFAASDTPG